MINRLKATSRKLALWLLQKANWGDIRIRHHYTGDPITLDAFKHRNYWFRGKRREAATMKLLRRLIKSGDTVLDAGGHIGYISIYFARLADPGKVVVFEPDPVNLSYLRRNVAHLPQIEIIEKGLAATSGERTFFVESLTGQNNSLYSDYELFKCNVASSGIDAGGYKPMTIDAVTVDQYVQSAGLELSFVKIDIEGAEFEALSGMTQTAASAPPILMVEVTRNAHEVFDWMRSKGYVTFSDQLILLESPESLLYQNVFCLHRERHQGQLAELGLELVAA
jgi:FkbM family methyltransferase